MNIDEINQQKIEEFVDNLINEKFPGGAGGQDLSAMKNDLQEKLMSEIEDAFIHALSDQKLAELNALLDEENPDETKVNDIFSSIDTEKIAQEVIKKFRQEFLAEGKE